MLPSVMMNEVGLYWMKVMEEDEKVDNIGNGYTNINKKSDYRKYPQKSKGDDA